MWVSCCIIITIIIILLCVFTAIIIIIIIILLVVVRHHRRHRHYQQWWLAGGLIATTTTMLVTCFDPVPTWDNRPSRRPSITCSEAPPVQSTATAGSSPCSVRGAIAQDAGLRVEGAKFTSIQGSASGLR